MVVDRYDSNVTHEDRRANRDVTLPTITHPPKIANRSPTFSFRCKRMLVFRSSPIKDVGAVSKRERRIERRFLRRYR